jgi:hypothetical protein
MILLVVALKVQGYFQYDSEYYLQNAIKICGGDWGGDSVRTPMYSWLLCGFSRAMPGEFGQIAALLLFQNLAVWFSGILIYRRNSRFPALLWMYDPTLLAYSSIVMTDCLFSVSILMLAFSLRRGLMSAHALRYWLQVGTWGAVAILLRPIGFPLILITWAFIGLLWLFRQIRLKSWLFMTAICLLSLSPVLYWNYSKTHRLYLAKQGDGWIQSVAGVVQYRGAGLSFIDAELRWHAEHPNAGTPEAYQTLLQYWPNWLILSGQGIARVLIGNVNTEYGTLFTGKTPIGPGWFKEGTDLQNRVRGAGKALWIAGVFLIAGFYLSLYWAFGYCLKKSWKSLVPSVKSFIGWITISAGLLVAVPQVYGDARFRVPILAILVIGMSVLLRTESYSKLDRS